MKKAEEAIPTAIYDTENADHELQASYGMAEAEYKPAFLYVERGPGAGQLLEVKQGGTVIGRASVSDLRIQHPSISRRHAQIKRAGDSFFVKDLGSQNGTFVNKQRIATEVEMKIGDTLAVGNALVKLRGPVAKGEKLGPPVSAPAAPAPRAESVRARQSTAVVARPGTAPTAMPPPQNTTSNALKVGLLVAGAMIVGLGAALLFALLKLGTVPTTTPVADTKTAAAAPVNDSEREKLIKDAIARTMTERAAAPAKVEAPVEEAAPVVRAEPKAAVVPALALPMPSARPSAPVAPPTVSRAAPVVAAKHPAKMTETDDDEESSAPAKPGAAKRTQILAPYEKGNAEGALELAKKAGDKELVGKLTTFIQVYDAANDAMIANQGTVAITNFQKALNIDEGLSSGWGKYGGEIRKQLASLYSLVGIQFAQNGDDDKARKAFEAALKHDPSNQRAKTGLEKLGGASAASAAAADEDAAPPKRAPVKSKPAAKPQSIDDAFGD